MSRRDDYCIAKALECVECGDASQIGEAGSAIEAAHILETYLRDAWDAGYADAEMRAAVNGSRQRKPP